MGRILSGLALLVFSAAVSANTTVFGTLKERHAPITNDDGYSYWLNSQYPVGPIDFFLTSPDSAVLKQIRDMARSCDPLLAGGDGGKTVVEATGELKIDSFGTLYLDVTKIILKSAAQSSAY